MLLLLALPLPHSFCSTTTKWPSEKGHILQAKKFYHLFRKFPAEKLLSTFHEPKPEGLSNDEEIKASR